MSTSLDQKLTGSKGFLERFTHFISGEPQNILELNRSLEAAYQRGILNLEALNIMQGALQVTEMQVREIMIPRSQMTVLKSSNHIKDLLPVIIQSQHSRFPVVGEDPDEIIGILLAKDLLPLMQQDHSEKIDIKELLRPAIFIPESKRLNILLAEFKNNRNHMAIVIDEYGTPSGLVTIEDILEQIVGDIEDEHDFENDLFIKPFDRDQYVVKAVTPVAEFNEHFKTTFSDEEFDTIGGLVINSFGHLPKRHETVSIGRIHFKVLNADKRSIRLLQVTSTETVQAEAS
ncbi:MAG: transporter associated domain-containing protein [Pseudomonadota bacterium]